MSSALELLDELPRSQRPGVAAALGMDENAVKVAAHRLRHRYREAIRDEIADTVAAEEEVEEEFRYLRAVLSRHPADWYIPFLVGVRQFHLELGNPLPWFVRALELNPRFSTAVWKLGHVYRQQGRYPEALEQFRDRDELRA